VNKGIPEDKQKLLEGILVIRSQSSSDETNISSKDLNTAKQILEDYLLNDYRNGIYEALQIFETIHRSDSQTSTDEKQDQVRALHTKPLAEAVELTNTNELKAIDSLEKLIASKHLPQLERDLLLYFIKQHELLETRRSKEIKLSSENFNAASNLINKLFLSDYRDGNYYASQLFEMLNNLTPYLSSKLQEGVDYMVTILPKDVHSAITSHASVDTINKLINSAEKKDSEALTKEICSTEGDLRVAITFDTPESIVNRLIDIAEKQNPQALTEAICAREGALRLAITFGKSESLINRLIDIAERNNPKALEEVICSFEGSLRLAITFAAPESITNRLIDIVEKQNPQALTEAIDPPESILRWAITFRKPSERVLERLKAYISRAGWSTAI
jgi:hypothetical protein